MGSSTSKRKSQEIIFTSTVLEFDVENPNNSRFKNPDIVLVPQFSRENIAPSLTPKNKLIFKDNFEEIENPDILCSFEKQPKPWLPVYLRGIDVTNIPIFFTVSEIIQGKWSYFPRKTPYEILENPGNSIERDFLSGKITSKIKIDGKGAKVRFSENAISIIENRLKNLYKISRESLVKEKFFWQAADGSLRPLLKRIDDILAFTDGELSFVLDGIPYHISIHKKLMIELCTGIIHSVLFK